MRHRTKWGKKQKRRANNGECVLDKMRSKRRKEGLASEGKYNVM